MGNWDQTFEVTEQHIKLISNMSVDWDYTEFGAPCIDPKRPYGNSDVYEDMATILELAPEDKYTRWGVTKAQKEKLLELHEETAKALQIILYTKSFEPGVYQTHDYWATCERISKSEPAKVV